MNQPFNWPANDWGGGANWFDVRSYGATPNDVGVGLQGAIQAAFANNAASTVYIPPLHNGQPWMWRTPIAIGNNSASVAEIRIYGAGAWIQLELPNPNSQYALGIGTLWGNVVIENLVIGGDATRGLDAIGVFNFGSIIGNALVRRCYFGGIQVNAGIVSAGAITGFVVDDCFFGGCSSTSAGTGVVWFGSGPGLTIGLVRRCTMVDFGPIGSYPIANKYGGASHVAVSWGTEVVIDSCNLDEQVSLQILVNPTANGRVENVLIRDTTFNDPAAGGDTILVNGAGQIHSLQIERMHVTSVGGANPAIIDVGNCDRVVMRDVLTSTMPSQSILVRSGVGTVELENCPGWGVTTSGAGFSYPTTDFQVDRVRQPYRINHAGSPYTLQQSQLVLYADASGGNITGNIPAANTMPDGWPMELRRTAGSFAVNNVTLTPAAGTIMDPQNPGNAPAASVVNSTNGAFRWRAGATENVWELA